MRSATASAKASRSRLTERAAVEDAVLTPNVKQRYRVRFKPLQDRPANSLTEETVGTHDYSMSLTGMSLIWVPS